MFWSMELGQKDIINCQEVALVKVSGVLLMEEIWLTGWGHWGCLFIPLFRGFYIHPRWWWPDFSHQQHLFGKDTLSILESLKNWIVRNCQPIQTLPPAPPPKKKNENPKKDPAFWGPKMNVKNQCNQRINFRICWKFPFPRMVLSPCRS